MWGFRTLLINLHLFGFTFNFTCTPFIDTVRIKEHIFGRFSCYYYVKMQGMNYFSFVVALRTTWNQNDFIAYCLKYQNPFIIRHPVLLSDYNTFIRFSHKAMYSSEYLFSSEQPVDDKTTAIWIVIEYNTSNSNGIHYENLVPFSVQIHQLKPPS